MTNCATILALTRHTPHDTGRNGWYRADDEPPIAVRQSVVYELKGTSRRETC